MFGEALELLSKVANAQPEEPPPEVRFRFRKDHPAVPHLKRVFKVYQTLARYDSGLEVPYGPPDDDSVEAFLRELREAAEAEGVDFDEVTRDVLGWDSTGNPAGAAEQILQPANLGRVMTSIFKEPGTADAVGPSTRRRYLNMGEDLSRRAT